MAAVATTAVSAEMEITAVGMSGSWHRPSSSHQSVAGARREGERSQARINTKKDEKELKGWIKGCKKSWLLAAL